MRRLRCLLLVLLSFMLLSCGESCEKTPTEVQAYVQEFEDTYGVDIEFEVLLVDYELGSSKGVLATCRRSEGKPPLVRIERSFWNEADYIRRRALVFHELGHCEFDLEHNPDLMPMVITDPITGDLWATTGPVSLMYPSIRGSEYYGEPRFTDHYVPQLLEEREAQKEEVREGEVFCESEHF